MSLLLFLKSNYIFSPCICLSFSFASWTITETVTPLFPHVISNSLPSLSCLPAKMSAPTIVPTPSKQTATAIKWISRYLARRMNQDKAISTGIPKQSSSCEHREMSFTRSPSHICISLSWKWTFRILSSIITRCHWKPQNNPHVFV